MIPDTRETFLNPVQNQLSCGNCNLHTWIAVLEIAHTKGFEELVFPNKSYYELENSYEIIRKRLGFAISIILD